jgi:error-prone DNA polymerase
LQSKLLMVQGKLQKEGEVIHVIVQHCEDWSKLLRSLTSTNKEDLPVLTLSPRDENNGFPFPTENKKTQVRKMVQEELFPKGRNFK